MQCACNAARYANNSQPSLTLTPNDAAPAFSPPVGRLFHTLPPRDRNLARPVARLDPWYHSDRHHDLDRPMGDLSTEPNTAVVGQLPAVLPHVLDDLAMREEKT